MRHDVASDWLQGEEALPILDEASVAVARQATRDRAAAHGLSAVGAERLALVVSELAHNQLAHARRGWIALRPIARGGVPGVEVVAADSGPGIADPAGALRGGHSTAGTLGVGLSGVRRTAAEMDLDVRRGEGTCVTARVFDAPVPRRREVGVYGRPHPDERTSGDGALFVRRDDALVLGVCDGLGHGEPARDAARAATSALRRHAALSPGEQLAACDRALGGTRGAVMTILHVDDREGRIDAASAGNVTTILAHHRSERRLGGLSTTLGGARPARFATERTAIDPRDVIVVFTDGLSSRSTLADDRDLWFQHPAAVAQRLVERFARATDDVLVAVVR